VVIMGSVMQELTDRERGILRNSLGLLYAKKPYRNHFVVHQDSENFRICSALAKRGYMEDGNIGGTGMVYFYTTQAGAAAIGVSERDYLAALK
jgi:hypothetical protein